MVSTSHGHVERDKRMVPAREASRAHGAASPETTAVMHASNVGSSARANPKSGQCRRVSGTREKICDAVN